VKVACGAVNIECLVQFVVIAEDFQTIRIKQEGILVKLLSLLEALVSLVLEVFRHLYDHQFFFFFLKKK
jgi:hypothetical protein